MAIQMTLIGPSTSIAIISALSTQGNPLRAEGRLGPLDPSAVRLAFGTFPGRTA